MPKMKTKCKRNYYAEIDDELKRIENFKYHGKGISWCCDRIAWCWKWRHITEAQMEELTDRVVKYFKVCRGEDDYY